MTIRAPESLNEKTLSRYYIKDDNIQQKNEVPIRMERDILSWESTCEIGRLIFRHIFCGPTESSNWVLNEELVDAVINLIVPQQVVCDESSSEQDIISLSHLENRPYIMYQNKYYLLPEKLEDINELDTASIISSRDLILKYIQNPKIFEKRILIDSLKQILNVNYLYQYVFDKSSYTKTFQNSKAKLFDVLYTIYILRRRVAVNLEYVMRGLQTLHVIEWLAIDEFLANVQDGTLDESQVKMEINLFNNIIPELSNVQITAKMKPISFINDLEELMEYFQALPIIHPIFPKLHWYKEPFNDIKPIGVGDLKVVKQILLGYKANEISHIINVMNGEKRERNHRRLEKTEEVMSFSSDQSTDSERETQSSDRFEVKREAENIMKSDLQVNANASLTYAQAPITANISGGFAYGLSFQDSQKTSSTYAHDIMDKAVTRVQNRAQQQRSITKTFETEETNLQKFLNNKIFSSHISGIYRWVDKKYRSQVYNYDKRLMFEFVIPEPAAFFVESRKKSFEFETNCPELPEKKEPSKVIMDIKPEQIDEKEFKKLSLDYDLKEFPFPVQEKYATLMNKQTGSAKFEETGVDKGDGEFWIKTYICDIGSTDYEITGFYWRGGLWTTGKKPSNASWKQKNLFQMFINGTEVLNQVDGDYSATDWIRLDATHDIDLSTNPAPISVDNLTDFTIHCQNIDRFYLSFFVKLTLRDERKYAFQQKVYDKIVQIKKQQVDKENQEKELSYNSKMADYRNKLNELNSTTINELLQGKAEAFNRELIRQELKKHCISLMAKEFDSEEYDDILSRNDAIEIRDVNVNYEKYGAGDGNCEFKTIRKVIPYPKINLEKAKKKAQFIQFLEQAFEWHHIAYIFYPYFWAKENKWIGLMNRLDNTDPHMTSFLQAGSVRVLLAVTPAYDDSVFHFLATREPWLGGPAPVIGDPLFLPLFEEIKKQQNDMENAKPEGKSWEFTLPTSLVYLHDSSSKLPEDF